MEAEQEWEAIEIRVEKIGNGFLARAMKDEGSVRIYGEQIYHPTMESVERTLPFGLKAAMALTRETGKADF